MIERLRIRISPTAFPSAVPGEPLTHMRLCHQAVKCGTSGGAVMLRSWEDNCGSDIALAMRHRLRRIHSWASEKKMR